MTHPCSRSRRTAFHTLVRLTCKEAASSWPDTYSPSPACSLAKTRAAVSPAGAVLSTFPRLLTLGAAYPGRARGPRPWPQRLDGNQDAAVLSTDASSL